MLSTSSIRTKDPNNHSDTETEDREDIDDECWESYSFDTLKAVQNGLYAGVYEYGVYEYGDDKDI